MTTHSNANAPATIAPVEKLDWNNTGLCAELVEAALKAGYPAPTKIQAESIPIALDGSDLIASSQTGSGKTASFVLPMIDVFMGRSGTFGLVLAPTREIANQIQETIDLFGKPRGITSAVLIGGVDMRVDLAALKDYPHIIVATPGRLCDHLDRGNIWLDYIEMYVLDEADRMLDMGFSDQLARITEELPENRQTLLYSATITPAVKRLAEKALYNPKMVSIGKPLTAAKEVEQRIVWLTERDKIHELLRLLKREQGLIIVFTRSKQGATQLFRSLHSRGIYDATYIHSDRPQSDREMALEDFKSGKYRILIATDVAGRGIHVDDVAHVVNYDLPMEPEDYIHRIGRTGRIGATGKATTFATDRDQKIVSQIERLLGHGIEERIRR